MDIPKRTLSLIAVLAIIAALGGPANLVSGRASAARSQQGLSPTAGHGSVQLPGRRLDVSAAMTPTVTSSIVLAGVMVTVTNTGAQTFLVQPGDFALSAEGDIFGQTQAPTLTAPLSGTVGPGAARAGHVMFTVPTAALPGLSLLYHPKNDSLVASIPLPISFAHASSGLTGRTSTVPSTSASAPRAAGSNGTGMKGTTATPTATVSRNTIEDVFTRPNQTGWGSSTNPDGVAHVVWGMDGDGSQPFVTISTNTGSYGYPGATGLVGIAAAGTTAFNGGDALAKFQMSAVGHMTPYLVQNACGDKSCYYGARLHTSQHLLEVAKRAGNTTTVLATAPFTASANTFYWLRLDVTVGSTDTIRAKVWADGTVQPATWMVAAKDGSPLGANPVGVGGTWDQLGSGESVQYVCYSYAAGGPASPCGSGPVPTPVPTFTPTPAATVGTVQEYPLGGGVGQPWGTAIDKSGNIWFAEPGCDFAPTCSSSTPPGQIGELPAGATTPIFWTLPQISGNQPIFVALDSLGNVWFTTPDNSMIGEFNPSTQQFVGQWAVTAGSGPWDLAFDGNGNIWYTEHLASAVGRFVPSTHTYTDFTTPTTNPATNPYGIATRGTLVWFTENNSSVARIAKLDTGNGNKISEYLTRSQLPTGQYSGLTPHMLAVDANGHPWWTEGWVRAIGTLDPSVATPGQCGTSSGDCLGVTEFALPAPPNTCSSSHVSGIALQGGGSLVWLDDSLSTQVGAYNPSAKQFALNNLTCGVHPHDGLNLDTASPPHPWWDEENANALGKLTQ